MDWKNTWGSDVLVGTNTNTRTSLSGASESYNVDSAMGRRNRSGKSKNPWLTPSIRRCAAYNRSVKRVVFMSPTRRTLSNGDKVTAWPSPVPLMQTMNSGISTVQWEDQQARCETECLNKFGEQKVQLANDLLESKKTFDMLAETSVTAFTALRDFRRGNWRAAIDRLGLSPKKIPKTARDKWLEFTYGWKPTISSVFDYQELVKKDASSRKVIMARRQISDTHFLEPAKSGDYWKNADGGIPLKYSSKCLLIGYIRNDRFEMAKEWGMMNPAGILWEAMPMSFVIDWVMPVGNVINAWTATAGIDFLTGSLTRRVEGTGSITCENYTKFGSWNGGSVDERSRIVLDYSIFDRLVYTRFPGPTIYIKSPFSGPHAITALALLHQLYVGH